MLELRSREEVESWSESDREIYIYLLANDIVVREMEGPPFSIVVPEYKAELTRLGGMDVYHKRKAELHHDPDPDAPQRELDRIRREAGWSEIEIAQGWSFDHPIIKDMPTLPGAPETPPSPGLFETVSNGFSLVFIVFIGVIAAIFLILGKKKG